MYGWFSWPGGSVTTNLVASAIFAAPVLWQAIKWAHKMRKSHEELHAKLDRVHQHLGIDPHE